jgi:pyrimidine operon attenuation protein/uracil phosphoribosyltransferase
MDALNDYGRPAVIRLATMIDRGHREVPIQPDFVGKVVPTAREESIQVCIPELDGREGVELARRG